MLIDIVRTKWESETKTVKSINTNKSTICWSSTSKKRTGYRKQWFPPQ